MGVKGEEDHKRYAMQVKYIFKKKALNLYEVVDASNVFFTRCGLKTVNGK